MPSVDFQKIIIDSAYVHQNQLKIQTKNSTDARNLQHSIVEWNIVFA
jgi:hypothetical protein